MTTNKEKALIKRWYKWLCDHDIGVMRWLYLSPLIACFTLNEHIFRFVLLMDCAVSITFSIGNAKRWNRED